MATADPGLDVVPPGDRLSLCSEQMGSVQGLGQGREFRIRRLFKGLAGYDVVVVDTSPVLTPLNVAILYAVSEIMIPIDPCVAALAGVRALEGLVRTVSEFRVEFTDAGPLTISGVLVTRSDRTLVSKQIESEVRTYFGDLVYERAVPASVKFREAYARGTPLIHYDPAGAGAAGYRGAARADLAGGRPGAVGDTADVEAADITGCRRGLICPVVHRLWFASGLRRPSSETPGTRRGAARVRGGDPTTDQGPRTVCSGRVRR